MTTSTLTVTDFVLARIAEDEAAAKGALSASGRGPWRAKSYKVVVDEGDFEVAEAAVSTALHIARHDPARILAQCAAMRMIAEGLEAALVANSEDPNSIGAMSLLGLVDACLALASIWDSHPDWREERRA